MNVAAIDKFVHGFPTTWKHKLVHSFALPSSEGKKAHPALVIHGKGGPSTLFVQERRGLSTQHIGESEEPNIQPRRSSRQQAKQQSALFNLDDKVKTSKLSLKTRTPHSKSAGSKGAATPSAPTISSGSSKSSDERTVHVAEIHLKARAAAAKSSPERKHPATRGKQPLKTQTPAPRPSPQGRMPTRKSTAVTKTVTKGQAQLKVQSTPIRKHASGKTRASSSPSTRSAIPLASVRKHGPSESKLPPPAPTPLPPSRRTPLSNSKFRSQPSLTTSTRQKHNSAASASLSEKTQRATIRVTRSTRSKSGLQPSASSAVTPKATSLAAKLRSAQEAKRARRSRRVAFAEVREETPASTAPNIAPETPKASCRLTKAVLSTPAIAGKAMKGGRERWTNGQLKAYERARNDVAADEEDYWGKVASSIGGKSAEECQKLWESTWTSPQVGAVKKEKMQNEGTPEMIAGLQRARRTAQGRGTGKFRTRTRLLAEKVASNLEDEILEPLVLEREGVQTPRSVEGMEAGTPGTAVREKMRGLEEAGRMETPEILKRGRSVGFKEADQYVGGFWRRVGKKRKGEDGEENEERVAEVGKKDEEKGIRMVKTDLGMNGMETEGCDYSDEEPFF